MTEAPRPIGSLTMELVRLMYRAVFSEGGISGQPAHDVILERAPIGAGLCASAYEEAMPPPS